MTTLENKLVNGSLIQLGLMNGYYIVRKQRSSVVVYQSAPIKDGRKARKIYESMIKG